MIKIVFIITLTIFTSSLHSEQEYTYRCIVDTINYNNLIITRKNSDLDADSVSNYYYSIYYNHPELDIDVIKLFETHHILKLTSSGEIVINDKKYKLSDGKINMNTTESIDNIKSIIFSNDDNNSVMFVCDPNKDVPNIIINKDLIKILKKQ